MKRVISVAVLLWLAAAQIFAQEVEFNVTMVRGRVYWKKADEQPFSVTPGAYRISSDTSLLTFLDGQCFLQPDESVELRMREESIVAINSPGEFIVRKGLVGFSSRKSPVKIRTMHLNIELDDGLLVIKSNSVLTRVCLIKGSARVQQGNGLFSNLDANNEVAAAPGVVSSQYLRSDELRFTWYWVDPQKEPALQ